MKKIISIVFFFAALMSFTAFAQNDITTVKGINFILYPKSMEATVVANDGGYSGTINIPENVTVDYEAYKVTGIATGAFKDCAGLKEVVIPSTVMLISEDAFVNVPEGLNIYINRTNRPFKDKNAFDQSCFDNATLHLPTERILKDWVKYMPYHNFKKTGIVPKAKSDGVDRRTAAEKTASNPRMKTSSKSKKITF